jgi:hypothetical protein
LQTGHEVSGFHRDAGAGDTIYPGDIDTVDEYESFWVEDHQAEEAGFYDRTQEEQGVYRITKEVALRKYKAGEDIGLGTRQTDGRFIVSRVRQGQDDLAGFIERNSQFYLFSVPPKEGTPNQVWGFDVTEQLKEGATQGFPMYQTPDDFDKGAIHFPKNQVWGFDVTEQLKEGATQGFPMYQTPDDFDKGAIHFPKQDPFEEVEAVIQLLEKADPSTFIHEVGHLFTEQLIRDSIQAGADPQTVADAQTALNHMGWEGTAEEWLRAPTAERRPGHELMARSFEKYMMEGHAPTPELQTLFTQIRRFLLGVYRYLNSIDAEINDEVRQMFDRMLVAENKIAEAQSTYNPMFKTAEEMGFSQGEWERYQRSHSDAVNRAEESAMAEVAKDIKRIRTAERKKVREEVEAEVMKDMANQARFYLTKGYMYGQEKPTDAKPIKLSKQYMKDVYGNEPWKEWKSLGNWFYSDKEGVNPEEVAELFGFASPADMINQMVANGNPEKLIDAHTNIIMEELYAELNTPDKIAQAAYDAVHGDRRAEFLALEAKALGKKTGRTPTPWQTARAIAKQMMGRKQVREAKAWSFLRNERKYADLAMRAAAAGKYDEALDHKQTQMLNHALYMEARQVEQQIPKLVKLMKRLEKKKKGRKNLDREILEQIDQRMDAIKAAHPDYDFRNAEVDLVLGYYDELKSLDHRARKTFKIKIGEDKRIYTEVREELIKSAGENWGKKEIDNKILVAKMKEQFPDWAKNVWAEHLKPEFLFELLDGGAKRGLWWRAMFEDIAEAENREQIMHEDAVNKLQTIWSRYTERERGAMHLNRQKYELLGNREFSKAQLISMALNMGNEDNVNRILNGADAKKEGWTREGIMEVLEDQLTDRDWDTVQMIWDLVDSYWNDIEINGVKYEGIASHEFRVNGTVPEKVQASPITLSNGRVLRGGYFPIKFDSKRSVRQQEIESLNELVAGGSVHAATAQGHVKERVGGAGKDVLFDLNHHGVHIAKVIHDLTHREAVMKVNRLLNDREVTRIIDETAGVHVKDGLQTWIARVAGEVQVPPAARSWEFLLRHLRGTTTIMNMGVKFTTAWVQILGYSQSWEEVGFMRANSAMVRHIWNPESYRIADEKSVFIRNRAKTLDRDIHDTLKNVGHITALDKIQKVMFAHIAFMDRVVSVPTWWAAYEKAMEGGASEKEAVSAGDQAVRMSQGSGSPKDLANIQAGPEGKRALTMFYSYFNLLFNLLKRSSKRFEATPEGMARASLSFLYLVVIPATVSELMMGKSPEEDDEEAWKWYAKRIGAYPFMSLVGVRDVANYMVTDYGYSPTPIVQGLEEITRAADKQIEAVIDISTGEAELIDTISDDKFAKSLMFGLGYVFGLPGRQMYISWSNTQALLEGEELSWDEWMQLRKHKQ